jgi:hypothetical protein
MAIMLARLANTTWAPFGGRSFLAFSRLPTDTGSVESGRAVESACSFLAFSRFTTDAGSVEDFNTLNASDATTAHALLER